MESEHRGAGSRVTLYECLLNRPGIGPESDPAGQGCSRQTGDQGDRAMTQPSLLPKHTEPAAPERGPRLTTASAAAADDAATRDFHTAVTEAIELSEAMVAEDDADPIDQTILGDTVRSLLPLISSLGLPSPVVLPLRNGGIGAEWHERDMNIELRFRRIFDVYAVIEDARGIVPDFHGRDPSLQHARAALQEFARRSDG
jgi:hypothetical protein